MKKQAKITVRKKQTETSEQKIVGFGAAMKNFMFRGDDLLGVAQRSELWWVTLIILAIFLGILPFITNGLLVANILTVLLLLPLVALFARRLHDIGTSAKILFFPCLILILNFVLSIFYDFAGVSILGKITAEIFKKTNLLYVVLLISSCMFLPSNLVSNKYRNLKKIENHNNAWVVTAYIVCAIFILFLVSSLKN